MCGLYASVGIEPDKLRLDRISHRGPDGEGWAQYSTPSGILCLGHRRLSIIDLDARANQPMVALEGFYTIIQNGEIYNYKELREELEIAGVEFRTSSDTEVLLNGFMFWGDEVFNRIRGMFACIIYDKNNNKLYAARDAYGIKPLYFVKTKDGFAFGSEIKQIYDLDGVSRRLNYPRTWDFLMSMTTDHTEETMFDGVNQIRPGHYGVLNLEDSNPELILKRWFEIPKIKKKKISLKQAATLFREKFINSIKIHLRADVPVGSCLSGGLDSSSVVGVACKLLDEPQNFRTYSVIFPETKVDESKYINCVNLYNKCRPNLVSIDEDRLENVAKKLIYIQDEPFGSTSIFAQYFVFEAIGKDKIKVVLDGQGADEQLAGYHGIFDFYQQSLWKRRKIFSLMRTIIERKIWHNVSFFSIFQKYFAMKFPYLFKGKQISNSVNIALDADLQKFAPKSGSTMNEALLRDNLGQIDNIGDLCLALTVGTNLPMLLRYEDRNSMAHSVEARVPFVDIDLIEFTIGLGEQHKIFGGDTKKVLREGVGDFLPYEVLFRRDKLGFSTPEDSWLHEPLKKFVKKGVEICFDRFPTLLNRAEVNKLLSSLDSKEPVNGVLWRIANLGHWAEYYEIGE
ncbi:MAG: asparagine synthase (glutamine-hydrolyzing) [Caulobacterales bacterium]|nr:asparagine synthase (glutamine-hydrolyzing) [Caulobacterales bacterium]MCA0373382.1 asparagine synthase (glutamine-hydrolyzing) [Pseudomonadota bacterium]